jgi:hypothetical protein
MTASSEFIGGDGVLEVSPGFTHPDFRVRVVVKPSSRGVAESSERLGWSGAFWSPLVAVGLYVLADHSSLRRAANHAVEGSMR